MDNIYGKQPIDLGLVDLNIVETMSWLYCPIKVPGKHQYCVPDNLKQFWPLMERILEGEKDRVVNLISEEDYVYITAKRLYVTPENPGNRPGWHSDGYRTSDLNFIWYDSNPTVFWKPDILVRFSEDDVKSLDEMEKIAEEGPHVTYGNKHLLLLTEEMIHKVGTVRKAGWRTFVKISVSKDKYDLEGNSINHQLNLNWTYKKRNEIRNMPQSSNETK